MTLRNIAPLAATLAAAALTACAPEVPETPTWLQDVRPIVLGNCVRCHTPPPIGGAPDEYRFDKYDDEDRDGSGRADVFGAGSSAMGMALRVESEEMPPEFPLLPRQIDVIAAWAEAGAPEGDPIEGNRAPTMELIGNFEQDDDLVVVDYRIDDADSDLVTGRVVADPDGDAPNLTVTFDLFTGVSRIVWDIAEVPTGSYELTAIIDDGSAEASFELGSVDVP